MPVYMKSDVAAKEMLQIARNLCGKKERKKGVCERGNTKGTKKSVGWSMVVGPWVESLASIISIMTVAEVIQQK